MPCQVKYDDSLGMIESVYNGVVTILEVHDQIDQALFAMI